MSTDEKQPPLFDPLSCDAIDLLEHMGDDVPPEHKWAPLLAALFRVFEAFNRRQGMSAEKATLDARDRCVLLGEYFGGRLVYIPKGERLRIAVRDTLIWHEHRGDNVEELATKWGLAVQTVYEILREQRALYKGKLQGKLFE